MLIWYGSREEGASANTFVLDPKRGFLMCNEWMRGLQLVITLDQFHALPRNSAFKYEYLGGTAYITPRARHYHAMLDLGARPEVPVMGIRLRPVEDDDWTALLRVFASAFSRVEPFGSLDFDTLCRAASQCLTRTRAGGDGPWISQASYIAVDESNGNAVGAILVTLLPDADPLSWDSYQWQGPPPPEAIERGLGRPHLTWVYVAQSCNRGGVGSLLLASAERALLSLRYRELLSTFMLGNDSSTLWHWRNGFRLLGYPGSPRRYRQLKQGE
jgi:ribosomal protein S18 acetylase RimI-like enzyme